MRAVIVLLVIVGILAVGAAYYAAYVNGETPVTFRTAFVKRDTLISTIGATGTAEPEDSIDIGSQVTGRIQSFGRDPRDPGKQVDYGTHVEEGTLLARIDPTLYKAQVDQSAAALAHAKADLLQLDAKRVQTEQEWKRAQDLLPKKAIADTDFDLAKANYLMAQANVEVGKATIQQCEAVLELANTNLGYTFIRAPFKGVIIDRRVNIGQTVVSAMSASSLFLLAKDLQKLQIWASVNEADIGRIRAGLPVHFTVATYPGETFEGRVLSVRLNAQSTQNVVTYTVVVGTENPPTSDYPNGKILPYMTTDLKFEVERHPDVLLVPNVALRWKPRPAQIAPDVRKAHADARAADQKDAGAPPDKKGEGKRREGKKTDSIAEKSPDAAKQDEQRGRIWVKDGDFVRPVKVQVGASDGALTEVSGPDVKDGTEVVIGESRATSPADDGDGGKNPFLPQMRRGNAARPNR
jgi:HlyD family secretion protein